MGQCAEFSELTALLFDEILTILLFIVIWMIYLLNKIVRKLTIFLFFAFFSIWA